MPGQRIEATVIVFANEELGLITCGHRLPPQYYVDRLFRPSKHAARVEPSVAGVEGISRADAENMRICERDAESTKGLNRATIVGVVRPNATVYEALAVDTAETGK